MAKADLFPDAFWRLTSTRTETGWRVAYIESDNSMRDVGEITTDGRQFTVWFRGAVTFAVPCHDFDTAIDCLRDYVDAARLGFTE